MLPRMRFYLMKGSNFCLIDCNKKNETFVCVQTFMQGFCSWNHIMEKGTTCYWILYSHTSLSDPDLHSRLWEFKKAKTFVPSSRGRKLLCQLFDKVQSWSGWNLVLLPRHAGLTSYSFYLIWFIVMEENLHRVISQRERKKMEKWAWLNSVVLQLEWKRPFKVLFGEGKQNLLQLFFLKFRGRFL